MSALSNPALFNRIASLEVQIDGLRRHQIAYPTARWNRISTVVVLHGGGIEGRGEDVSYDPRDQASHLSLPDFPLSGTRTLAEWSAVFDTIALTPTPLVHPESSDYRRWAYEGALLDLALRQAGMSLQDALGRQARPVRFCVSPPGDARDFAAMFPQQELKVDAFVGWTPDAMQDLAGRGTVRVVDLKAHYVGDWITRPDDPLAFSRSVAAAFPDVILEDPAVGAYMAPFHVENAGRTSFDAPIHKAADLMALPPTNWCNIKPSRFGTLERLLDCVDYCEQQGISMYGGGQFEIGPGRTQIQALASVLYPDGPNDVAPSGYNAAKPDPGLPRGTLPATTVVGFATAVEMVG